MNGIALVARRSLVERRGRSIMAMTGIALGVAMLGGAIVTIMTINRGVENAYEGALGEADVLVSSVGAAGASLPPSIVSTMERVDGVESAAAVLTMRTVIQGRDMTADDIASALRSIARAPRLVGIDLDPSQRFYPYRLERGRLFEHDRAEVLLPSRLAKSLGLDLGDTTTLSTPTGDRDVTLVGILADSGAGRFNQGRVAFVSLSLAQRLEGRSDALSLVIATLDEEVDAAEWVDDHASELGEGVIVTDASTFSAPIRDGINALGAVFAGIAIIVLFVATFLIYLTLSMTVTERTRLYGTMRAIGVSRRQLWQLVGLDAGAVGATGVVLGLLLGLGLAAALVPVVSHAVSVDSPGLVLSAGALMGVAAVGAVATLLAAVIPARRAGRLDPVDAMRGDHDASLVASRTWLPGVVCLVAGAVLLRGGSTIARLGPAILFVLLGSVLLVPVLVAPLARTLGAMTQRLSGGVGRVSVQHLVRERSRSAFTLALMMVVFAMTFAIGSTASSLRLVLDRQLSTQFGADLQLVAASSFTPEFVERLQQVPDVEALTPLWSFGTTKLLDTPGQEMSTLQIIDPATYFDVEGFSWIKGSDTDVRTRLEGGDAVVVPEGIARRLARDVGDELRLLTAKGPRSFTIAGVFASIGGRSSDTGALVVGLPDGTRYFDAGPPTDLHLRLANGVDPDVAEARIESDMADSGTFLVKRASEVKADTQGQLDVAIAGLLAILLLAGIVGLLGLANSLAVSVVQRFREIGVLRAIGSSRRQVRGLAIVESMTLLFVAFVLSIPLGRVLSVLVVRSASAGLGSTLRYSYPWSLVPVTALLAAVLAIGAAVLPSRRAVELEIVEALRCD